MNNKELGKLKRDYVFSKLIEDIINMVCEDMKKLQLDSGTKDEYGQGMYNGMELIRVSLLNKNPIYINKDFVLDDH